MPRISVVTPCYNEELNVRELYAQVKAVFSALPRYTYEHLFIDNASIDGTVSILKELAAADKSVKIIVNSRNFGHIRSPYYGLLQSSGDAAILLFADLQDPPSMIRDFIRKWEEGFKIVLGVKETSEETASMFFVRKLYYRVISGISEIKLTKNSTGFGLYDRKIIDIFRVINDPYPYFRGLVADVGFESAKIPYKQARRKRGISANNFYSLYDMAMLGITNHSKVPLRLATMIGFAMACISFVIALGYLAAKLMFWNLFQIGTAPIVVGFFFFSSVQLFFIGLIGEYIGSIHTQVLKRPLVIERERVNF